MLCKVQVSKRVAHYCTFAHALLNHRNIKTTTLNLKCVLYIYCNEFEAKFFSRLGILQPAKLAFDCH